MGTVGEHVRRNRAKHLSGCFRFHSVAPTEKLNRSNWIKVRHTAPRHGMSRSRRLLGSRYTLRPLLRSTLPVFEDSVQSLFVFAPPSQGWRCIRVRKRSSLPIHRAEVGRL